MKSEQQHDVKQLEEEFGPGKDVDDATDPLIPGRKTRVVTACGCILGTFISL